MTHSNWSINILLWHLYIESIICTLVNNISIYNFEFNYIIPYISISVHIILFNSFFNFNFHFTFNFSSISFLLCYSYLFLCMSALSCVSALCLYFFLHWKLLSSRQIPCVWKNTCNKAVLFLIIVFLTIVCCHHVPQYMAFCWLAPRLNSIQC